MKKITFDETESQGKHSKKSSNMAVLSKQKTGFVGHIRPNLDF